MKALLDLTRQQKHTVAACYLGWTLDAFDFFILVFVMKDIAAEFATDIKSVTLAITLTLAARPIGALLFGMLADKYGRRPVLMYNVLAYSLFEFASGFAPSLTVLIALRFLYGIAMGGEWGVGASLAMESMPVKARGLVSGILQTGYPSGYLFASLVFYYLFPMIGWRGMFMVGIIPAFLVLYIRRSVDESPVFAKMIDGAEAHDFMRQLKNHWGLFLWAVVMMTCFNFFSHGSQDIYPTFLRVQHKFSPAIVTMLTMALNVGAILGGVIFGSLSERIGRRRAIVLAALLALPIIPLWAFSTTPLLLGLGAFLIQIAIQGAWGVVPVHLNELSPPEARGAFPGFAYQIGNLIAAANATLQTGIAEHNGNNYGMALAVVCAVVAVVLSLVTWFGPEAKGVSFSG
jgi:SHS family lactate transporter-like MFS transporter